jgi:hypothetical protein
MGERSAGVSWYSKNEARMYVYSRRYLTWKKCALGWALHCYGKSGGIVHVVPDRKWPNMWRIKWPDGTLSDMANLTWARDGAMSVALGILNNREIITEAAE